METIAKDVAETLVTAMKDKNNPTHAKEAKELLGTWLILEQERMLQFEPKAREILEPFM
ncbi:MAG: hypothetical protein Q8R67_12175 [Rhodoferax sp.]|nr:hypothetical protein [Rhodoferax sp.]MDP3652429.1 hypothetical protein [Rhodoferax sp.]